MTPQDVLDRVAYIRGIASHDEDAHSEEDKLREDVLLAIARGEPHASEMARFALETSKINFARWCA